MSEIKGYVACGNDGTGPIWYKALPDDTWDIAWSRAGASLLSLGDALKAAERLPLDRRIFAVHADGTETPLSSYAEALAEVDAAHAALDPIVAQRDTVEGPPLALSVRAETAAKIVEDFVEKVTAMGADLQGAHGERDALRAERDTERKVWARLVKAAETDGGEFDYADAKLALRDLGVDVDALLNDG